MPPFDACSTSWVSLSETTPERHDTPVELPEPDRPGRRQGRWVVALVGVVLVMLVVTLRPVGAELGDEMVFIGQEHDRVDGLAWADMDGDGDLDVAVSNRENNLGSIGYVYENAGNQSFNLKWTVDDDHGERLGYPAWGDLEGDGDLDVAFGFTVYANNGTGLAKRFEASAIASGDKPTWVDYDGDGDLDFALGGAVYSNDNGTLSTTPALDLGGDLSAWGDVEGDGDQDVALIEFGEPWVWVYRNNGSGNFGFWWEWKLIQENTSHGDVEAKPSDLGWGDFDGDLDLDLATSSLGWNKGFLFAYDGNTFVPDWDNNFANPEGSNSIAWGDWDNGGFPELAFARCSGELSNCADYRVHLPPEVYENRPDENGGRQISNDRAWISYNSAEYVEWADWDADGDVDLSTGFDGDSEIIYVNDETGFRADVADPVSANHAAWANLDADPALELITDGEVNTYNARIYDLVNDHLVAWASSLSATGFGVAAGDWDGDGDVDIAVGGDVFRRTAGGFQLFWSASNNDGDLWNPVWGDWNGDDKLELILHDADQVYLYQYREIQGDFTLMWESDELTAVYDSDWGDMDGDGDLDLAIARGWDETVTLPSQVYENVGGSLTLAWEAPVSRDTMSIAWGDWDGDGDPDLALGNDNERNQVYANDGGAFSLAWESNDFYTTQDIVWLDYDGDGDMDLAAGNAWHDAVIYNNGALGLSPAIALPEWEVQSLAVGDADRDGDSDILAIDNSDTPQARFLENKFQDSQRQTPYRTYLSISAPAPQTSFYGAGSILEEGVIPIEFTLFHHDADKVARVEAFYSVNGGGQWLPAKNSAGQTSLTHLAASPGGVTHTHNWDTYASGLFGLFDNVVFRIDVYAHADDPAPAGTYRYPNAVSRSYQRPARVSARTTPFRVRGTQVEVVQQGGQPAAGAMVYRLPVGQSKATLIGNGQDRIFTTDSTGHLQGHGALNPGDKLVALWPAPAAQQPDDYPYTLYYTSAAVTTDGPQMHTVGPNVGVQTLTVSANNPLLLFDLVVSLEWDARNDPTFMDQLQRDIGRASEILYDLTDGQAALGNVHIYHDKGHWGVANVVIPAGNHIRPAATLGGIVPEPVNDVDRTGAPILDAYIPGQVRIGPTWNRFGDAEGTLGEDWPRTLAHELGHLLFYLPDNYLGIENNALTLVDCPGSAMSDPYRADYSEFLPRGSRWSGGCLKTVAEQYMGQADWETIIEKFYPALRPPAAEMTGPPALPLQLTQFRIFGPEEDPTTLAAPFFNIADAGGSALAIPQGRGQAYLIKQQRGESGATARYVVELGSPVGPLLNARGAAPGDELCVFDNSAADPRLGCVTVGQNPGTVRLYPAAGWRPVVTVTGRTNDEKTVDVVVSDAAGESALMAQLLPALGDASAIAPMERVGQNWRVTLTVADSATPPEFDGAFYGHVRVWVPGASPARQIIVAYTNLEAWQGYAYAWGGYAYAWGNPQDAYNSWGGYAYAWGGYAYAWGAPVMSGDGQVSFLPQKSLFGRPEMLSLQGLAAADLDPWLTQVGQAYRLRTLNGDVPPGSILFRYLPRDVPDGMEDHLAIYYQAEGTTTWGRLESTRQPEYNHVAAPAQPGSGTYALVATVQMSPFDVGWNPFAYPIAGSQQVGTALASLGDKYTSVYHFDNVWRLYDRTVAAEFATLVNTLPDLEFAKAYWLYATAPGTLYLSDPETAATAAATPNRYFPPATYYGYVTPASGFNPVAGQTLTAVIGNVECGRTTLVTHGGKLAYVVQVQAAVIVGPDDGCGREGREIVFKVNNVAVAGENQMWNNNAANLHPLGGEVAPLGWTHQPINTTPPGSFSDSSGVLSLSSWGRDIWNPADGFDFAYKACSGDVDLIAHVTGFNPRGYSSAKAGVMLRESLAPGSRHVTLHLTGTDSRLALKKRETTDEPVRGAGSGGLLPPPVWLKLSRRGNQITAYHSPNGTSNWTPIGETVTTVPLPATFYCGLAVSAGVPSPTAAISATFDNVRIDSPNAPQLTDFTPKSGPAGTVVTLTGVNLSDVTGVTFNNVAAAFSDNTATQVKATVPAGATDGRIRVMVGGQTLMTTTDFDVTPPTPGGPTLFYLSMAGATTVGSFTFQPADIVEYNRATNAWRMVYQGAHASHQTTQNVTAFDLLDDGSLLLVFAGNQIIPGLGTATPWDVVRFTPQNPGSFPLGAGTYSWFFQGKLRGLTTVKEKIDAVDLIGNQLLLSIVVVGGVTRPNGTTLKPADEDVFAFNLGTNQWESALRIDGSKVTGMATEDITGLWDDPQSGDYYVTLLDSFTVGGVSGGPNSIVKLTPNGGATVYTPSLVPWVTVSGKVDGLDMRP